MAMAARFGLSCRAGCRYLERAGPNESKGSRGVRGAEDRPAPARCATRRVTGCAGSVRWIEC